MKKRILVATANPDDSSQIRTDRFVAAIEEGLQRAEKSDSYIIETVLASNLKRFFTKIEIFQPHILHLIGHGNRLDNFAFETVEGKRELANPKKLASTIHLYANIIECVVISACHSKVLAQEITNVINYAVGYDDTLELDVAKEYANWFYFYLANRNSFFETAKKVRICLQNKIPNHKIPVLYVKSNIVDEIHHDSSNNRDADKEQIMKLIENNLLDDAFRLFIKISRGSQVYRQFLIPLNISYREYKDDKLAGKNVSGRLADISQRLMVILEKYE